jgi:EAL domain-containing protein (putative c-di-GMP-specific phosphodiesterase class I)
MTIDELTTHVAVPPPEYFAEFSAAYSEETDRLLLHLIDDRAIREIKSFVESFYDYLGTQSANSEILARLSQEDLEHLKVKQAQHLLFVLAAGTTPQTHYQRAMHVGWVHELVGLDLSVLMNAYHLFQQRIKCYLDSTDFATEQRERLIEALNRRLQLDLEAQIASHSRYDVEMASLVATLEKAIQDADNLADLLRDCLQIIGDSVGIEACLLSRPDTKGIVQIEAYGGQKAQLFAEALQSLSVSLFEIHSKTPLGSGPNGRAWRTGQIHIINSYDEDATGPLRGEEAKLGFRSSVAIPLLDESRQAFAILNMYSSWPGFFSSIKHKTTLLHIQQAMSHAILRCEQTTVIPAELRRVYRQQLDDGAVKMLYQPIIDLRTGKLYSVEALARLCKPDGGIFFPAEFLPAFGNSALLRLFQLGFNRVCRDIRMWRDQSAPLILPVAINLPPEGLIQDAYRDSILETLSNYELPPSIVQLEMLETGDSPDLAKRDARIAEFQQAGIGIVQDDLGSGHSSLLRMDRLPFDGVKIDQALVRSAISKPFRALELIYHLTLLANDFGVAVTVEGLEDEALIEAAAILGADYGQGYGIARAMPAHDLMSWSRSWSLQIDPRRPRTSLGALAGYMLWDRKLKILTDWPDLAERFITEPSLVQRYLDCGGKIDSQLFTTLERDRTAALQEPRTRMYAQTRHELIERLGTVWLEARK